MSTLCFIPARGGSKRIPRKNVRSLSGKPLLSYTIEVARECGRFAEIVVSSDDAEVLALAREFDVRDDERPLALAGDRIQFPQVLEEYLLRDGNAGRFDEVVVMLPTCPFRHVSDVDGALELFRANPDASVVSITTYDFPPEFACDYDATGATLKLRMPEVYAGSTQSQSLPHAYHPNGALYIGGVNRFLATRSFYAPPILGYLMPPERSYDIDYPYQWQLAEALMEARTSSVNSSR